MSDLPAIQTFQFNDTEILWVELDGEKYVVPKRICESFGLSWGSQQQKLTKNQRYHGFINHIDIETVTGRKTILILHASKYHSWINQIDTERVGEVAREKLLTFQRDSDRALHEYWTTGLAINQQIAPLPTLTPELQAMLQVSSNFLQSLQVIAGQAQAHTQAIAEIREELAEIKADRTLGLGQFTFMGYARTKRKSLSDATVRAGGRLCSKRCRAMDIEIGKEPHPRWGFVNTYPEWVIAEVWRELNLGE